MRALQLVDGCHVVGRERGVRRIDLVRELCVLRQVGDRGRTEEARRDVGPLFVHGLHAVRPEALDDELVLDVVAVQPALLAQYAQGVLLDARVDLGLLDLQEQLLVVALDPVHVLLQGRHARARELRAEPAARVQLGDLRRGEVLDLPRRPAGEDLFHVGGPGEAVVVHDHQLAVLGAVDVVLDPREAMRSPGRPPPACSRARSDAPRWAMTEGSSWGPAAVAAWAAVPGSSSAAAPRSAAALAGAVRAYTRTPHIE